MVLLLVWSNYRQVKKKSDGDATQFYPPITNRNVLLGIITILGIIWLFTTRLRKQRKAEVKYLKEKYGNIYNV